MQKKVFCPLFHDEIHDFDAWDECWKVEGGKCQFRGALNEFLCIFVDISFVIVHPWTALMKECLPLLGQMSKRV